MPALTPSLPLSAELLPKLFLGDGNASISIGGLQHFAVRTVQIVRETAAESRCTGADAMAEAGCDCDGVRRVPTDAGGAEGAALRAVLTVVEHLTHVRPTTCPWRAMSEPIVREVLEVSWACDPPNLAAVMGHDPDHKLTQAVGVYRRALRATW